MAGKRPDGRKIGTYIDKSYSAFKNQINPLAGYGNVDLIVTGQFVNSFFVKPFGLGFIFDATDRKRGNLLGRYGGDIMGLNQEWFNKRQKDIYKNVLSLEISKVLNKR